MTTAIRMGSTVEVGLGLDFDSCAQIGERVALQSRRHRVRVDRVSAALGCADPHGNLIVVRGMRGAILHTEPASQNRNGEGVMTLEELETALCKTATRSRNESFPLRRPLNTDIEMPVYREAQVRPIAHPRGLPRKMRRGFSVHDIWIWSPSGHRVEARFDTRSDAAPSICARYAEVTE